MVYNDMTKSFGAVCNMDWSKEAADVACRQLGYTDGAAEGKNAYCHILEKIVFI